ncbi:putative amid-like mitochondrial protein [Neofusicoccum parvum UCRNP2]|uniref:Putative amid-like mitochondrial protein n=1 Tax=Botryosphaeria parva (strain UCR-NP2) TaxID=1287680 RepID=R1GGU6_BOTPV|nr:putative amid-like mitochondrial protein [Neofusicoccum parvum UCRNP2]
MSTSKDLNIVVLGASWAGLGSTHYIMKHVLPSLPTRNGEKYHVYLVSPSSDVFWRIGAPRAAASSQLLPDSKIFLPIAPGLKQYDSSKLTFLIGAATAWDPTGRTVTVKTGTEGAEQSIPYHALLIATGTRTPSPLLGLVGSSEESKQALREVQEALKTAKSVFVAGGGPAGVETAGEIGEFLNGSPGWFQSGPPKHQKAVITVATNAEKILPVLRPAIAEKAGKYLARVGVIVKKNARVEGAEKNKDGTTTVTLSTGDSLTVDVYIPATGVKPNTEFVPKNLITEKGYIDNNATTLRVDGAGPRVFAVGDVGSSARGGVMDLDTAIPVVMTNLSRDLHAFADAKEEKEHAKPTGADRPYKPNTKETQLVPIGQSKGVGAVFGWKLPSFFVWMIKGRDYFTSMGPGLVDGSKWKKESPWKAPVS